MTFIESVKTATFNKYATFDGRASRSEFWWYILFTFLIHTLGAVIFYTFFNSSEEY